VVVRAMEFEAKLLAKVEFALNKAMFRMNAYMKPDGKTRQPLNKASLMAAAVAARVFKHYNVPCRGVMGYCNMDIPGRGPVSVLHAWVTSQTGVGGTEQVTDLTYSNPGRAVTVMGKPVKYAVNAIVPDFSLEPRYAVPPQQAGAPTFRDLAAHASDLDSYLARASPEIRDAVDGVLKVALDELADVQMDATSMGLDVGLHK
jgi:hypothetical protein